VKITPTEYVIIFNYPIQFIVDRGATRELVVSGMSRTNLVAILEWSAVQKGFRIVKKEYFHSSTLISAQKGSFPESVAASIISQGMSAYSQSGNVFGMDADISERGGRLRLYICVYPRTGGLESGSFFSITDHPILDLVLDPSSNKLLEDLLGKMRARGVVLEPFEVYQDTIGLKAGEKTIDDTGWTVQRSPEIQMDVDSSYDYRFWGFISSIIGFVGFVMIMSLFTLGLFSSEGTITAFICIGSVLSLFGIPGLILSIAAITRSGSEKSTLDIVSIVLSSLSTITAILVVLYGFALFFGQFEGY
jgi:hypothetical protein